MDIKKEELFYKARAGKIQPNEIAYVIAQIQKYYEHPNEENIHSLLQTISYASRFCQSSIINEYKGLIEKFIIFPEDPMVSVTALCVLCDDWNLTSEYISQLKSFLRGVEWDKDRVVRVKAISIVGRYIRETGDKKCLEILLEIFKNERERRDIRQLAYESIYIALNKEIDMNPQNLMTLETLAKAYEQLRNTKNEDLTLTWPIDIRDLYYKAYDGKIQPNEIAYVIDRIQKYYEHPNEEDIHSLLQTVGYAGCFCRSSIIDEYKGLIEKFIIFPEDPFVSVTALDVLCNDWDLAHEYIGQIKSFVRGVEWDKDMQVRVQAICAVAEYIRETRDKECLEMLLEIFKNVQEKKSIRELAYEMISRALGKDWKDLEKIDIDTYPQNLMAQKTIAKAYELLAEKSISRENFSHEKSGDKN